MFKAAVINILYKQYILCNVIAISWSDEPTEDSVVSISYT